MNLNIPLTYIKSLAIVAGLSFCQISLAQVKMKTAADSANGNQVTNPGSNEVVGEKEVENTENAQPAPRKINTSVSTFNKHWVGIGIGQTFLYGKYDKYGDDKISWDVFYAYTASYSFDFLVNFHYAEFKRTNTYIQTTGLNFDIKSRIFDFDSFSPFLVGGLGLYLPKAQRKIGNDYFETESKIVIGLNFGGGIDLKLNDQFSFGFLGVVHDPLASKQDNQSDLKGFYLKLMMTAMLAF